MSITMMFVYAVLVIGAVSSYLNYTLQKDWRDHALKRGKYKEDEHCDQAI